MALHEGVLLADPIPYLVEQEDARWRCTEDRPGEPLGPQIAGGVGGLVIVSLLEQERTAPGSVRQQGAPVNEYIEAAAKAHPEAFAPTHEACAGRGAAKTILTFMAENDATWFDATKLDRTIQPGAIRHYLEAKEAAKRLLASGLVETSILPGEEITPLRDRDPADRARPVPHKAATMVSVYDRRQKGVLDTTAAWEYGAAYGYNPLLVLQDFDTNPAHMSLLQGGDPESAALIATYYQAATRNNLPGQPSIVAIGPDRIY